MKEAGEVQVAKELQQEDGGDGPQVAQEPGGDTPRADLSPLPRTSSSSSSLSAGSDSDLESDTPAASVPPAVPPRAPVRHVRAAKRHGQGGAVVKKQQKSSVFCDTCEACQT